MPGRVEGKRGGVIWFYGVTDEAARRMRVERDHEKERKVVRVPERLETLMADFVVGGRVH